MIEVWKISENGREDVHLEDHSSLDAVTRQLPEGYYSTFRTYEGGTRVLGLKSHLRRLYDPIETADASASQLRRSLIARLAPFRPGEARVRAVMTNQGQLYLAIEPLQPLPPGVYEQGVRVETTALQRDTPRIKSTAFIRASEGERRHLAREGVFEALLVREGKILEGMTSNFFYVLGGEPRLGTARRDILPGVTRKTVLRLARGRGVEVSYRPLKLDQLSDVSEAFLTSSSRGVVPVVHIDERRVGQGRPGPITRMLLSDYAAYVSKHAEKI